MTDLVDTIFNMDNTTMSEKPTLRIIKLGSDVGATKNMTVYECGDDIIVVDCGIGLPDAELLGVDVVIPDVTYLLERKNKIRGLFISHAHEDHFGAVPYVIEDLQCPIYANKIVQAFVKERLKDKSPSGTAEGVSFHLITPETAEIVLGNFKVKAFGVNHSVPSGMGFAITTPQGVVLHMADYKIDWTPVLDKPIELGKIAAYGDKGVLCLLSDCLGINAEGYTKSEAILDATFDQLFDANEGRQIFITTLSSNISRMFQITKQAVRHGRKVVFSGRSIEQSARIARDLGYLPFDSSVFIEEKKASEFTSASYVTIIAGSYGQPGSGLDRLSHGEHNDFTLEESALVVFSADPNPPGVQEPVEKLLHNLTVAGAEVIYHEIQDNLHVSGHGLRGDLTTVTAMSKAKYYIPIGGTAAKMRAYTYMCAGLGIDKKNVYELLEGQVVEFTEHGAHFGDKIEVKQIYLDGKNSSPINEIVVRDREQLSNEGVFVVLLPVDKEGKFLTDKVEIVTRGFIYVKGSTELMDKSRKFIEEKLNKLIAKDEDLGALRKKLEREINRMLYKECGRVPLIIVHTLEV